MEKVTTFLLFSSLFEGYVIYNLYIFITAFKEFHEISKKKETDKLIKVNNELEKEKKLLEKEKKLLKKEIKKLKSRIKKKGFKLDINNDDSLEVLLCDSTELEKWFE